MQSRSRTLVKELMKANPVIIPSSASLREAAEKMKSQDCGVLPVGNWDRLEGMITDRDIAIRAVAEGIDPGSALVRDYMTRDVHYCSENDTLAQAGEKMRRNDVGRLVVRDSSGKACGIITFGCIMRKDSSLRELGEVIECAVGNKAA